MDAASERTWMYLQRVSGDSFHSMPLTVNGTAVIYFKTFASFALFAAKNAFLNK